MRANEFEINKFSGVINSVVNPDPKTSAICTNFDLFTIEGALQVRKGIKKFLDFNFPNLPFEPSREIIGFTTFYSEKYDREFFIVAVNENYNYSSRLTQNISICNFYVYPSFIKINGNYQIIDIWTSINQFAIGEVIHFEYDLVNYTRKILVDLIGMNDDRINNSFLYWTGIILDKNSNKVKNTFYVSGEHRYDKVSSFVEFNLDNDYNIQEQDKIILVKNYVKIKSNYFGVEDYFGLIPPIEKIKFYQNDTGINVLSSNLPVLKICLDFNKIVDVQQVIDSRNFILDNNFNDFETYWRSQGVVETDIIEDKRIVRLMNNSSIESSSFRKTGAIKIEIEFRTLNDGDNNLTGSIIYFDPVNEQWDIYDDLGIITNNSFLTNDKNKWYRVVIYRNLTDNYEYKIELRNPLRTGNNRFFEISDVRIYLINPKINLLSFNNHIQNFYLQNEPFGNNGFYIQPLAPDLLSLEDFEKSIKNNNEVYSTYILSENHTSSQGKIMADRIIVSLNSVNELCIYQKRHIVDPQNINNRNFVINYKLLNRRINEFTAYFSEYTSSVLVEYYLLPFYKIQDKINLTQEVLLDGRIFAFYSFDHRIKVNNLTDYLGYEAGEELIKKWNIQENNYIAQVETKAGKNYYQIYYPAINGNGVFMNDIYPLGNIIQIPVEGGFIQGLSISKIRNMFILKTKAVYLLDLDTNSLIKLSYSDGLIGDRAYISDGYSVYWLDVNGIKVSDGTQIINLTKNLNNLDYLSLANKDKAIVYLNGDLKSLEFCLDNQIFSYPIDGVIYNFNKTTNFNIKDLRQNYLGEIYYLGDRIYKQTRLNENIYSDENYLPALNYETNEFDVVKLGEQFPNDTRISINEIFIEYKSKSDFYFSLIGDGNVISSFRVPASTKKLERFQIAGSKEKNLFKSVKLRITRDSYYDNDAEEKAYLRVYSIGFSWIPQQIARQFRNG